MCVCVYVCEREESNVCSLSLYFDTSGYRYMCMCDTEQACIRCILFPFLIQLCSAPPPLL